MLYFVDIVVILMIEIRHWQLWKCTTVFYQIITHHILSHIITYHDIISHHITSHHVMSHHITSHNSSHYLISKMIHPFNSILDNTNNKVTAKIWFSCCNNRAIIASKRYSINLFLFVRKNTRSMWQHFLQLYSLI